ncbi:MAG: signal peptidase I [Planctomycetaceae bacterium]
MAAVDAIKEGKRSRHDRLRLCIELGVSLAILVLLFRTFLAGGYLIETGSMAPCLLGCHVRLSCPACGLEFAVDGKSSCGMAACPNCGQSVPATAHLRNDGDHLFVHRSAFFWRRPRRWEVVVFRNPQKSTQAFVKRVVGLPGETVEIRDGDVFINGALQAKDYSTQCGMRIPVYDHDHFPTGDDPDWRPRWLVDRTQGGWSEVGGEFHFAPQASADESAEWVCYRHWVRRGGAQKTVVPLEAWPAQTGNPEMSCLAYDESRHQLVCRGAMSHALRDELLNLDGVAFRDAIDRLYEASHIAPITDFCGYNCGRSDGNHEVRDLMISLEAEFDDQPGAFFVELSDGSARMQCEFDVAAREVRLHDLQTKAVVRNAPLPRELVQAPTQIEFSLMDRQVLLAVGGRQTFEPWNCPPPGQMGGTPWQPVRWGARGMAAVVRHVRLYRDVHYTVGDPEGRTPPRYQLGPDQYFVLGDNSPVSRDSRVWPAGVAVTSELLLGKPLAVHLPSRRTRLKVGSWQTEIRIPEPSRIRYIR